MMSTPSHLMQSFNDMPTQSPLPRATEWRNRLKVFDPTQFVTSAEPLVLNMSQESLAASFTDFNNLSMPLQQQMNHQEEGNNSLKRTREELNLKEKKRMSKLNERIQEFKDLLDTAGIASKKNKQSILDNTALYIKMLKSDLSNVKSRAQRAEEQIERPSKVRKLVESCALPMLTGKLTGEMTACSPEFVTLTGHDLSDLEASAATLLTCLGETFQMKLKQLVQSNETKIVFNDKVGGEKPCRFALSLLKGHDASIQGYQCILIPLQ